MKKKTKIIVISILFILFSAQLFSYAYEGYIKKGKYLFKEKMAALRVATILAERKGKEEEIKAQYELLAKTCEETANTPFLSRKLRRRARRRLAEAKFKLGEQEEALQICDELLADKPIDKATLKVKAKIYWERGKDLAIERRYDEAIGTYQDIIYWDITPELNAFFKYNTAHLCLQKGDIETAVLWYQKIIDEHSDLLNWPACATYSLGEIYSDQDDIKKARKLYQKIINKYPKSSWVKAASMELKNLNED